MSWEDNKLNWNCVFYSLMWVEMMFSPFESLVRTYYKINISSLTVEKLKKKKVSLNCTTMSEPLLTSYLSISS